MPATEWLPARKSFGKMQHLFFTSSIRSVTFQDTAHAVSQLEFGATPRYLQKLSAPACNDHPLHSSKDSDAFNSGRQQNWQKIKERLSKRPKARRNVFAARAQSSRASVAAQ